MSVSIRIRSCPSVSRLRRSLRFPDSYQRVAGDSWGTFDDCLTIQNRIKRYVSNLSSSILGGPRSRGRGRGVEPVQTGGLFPPSFFALLPDLHLRPLIDSLLSQQVAPLVLFLFPNICPLQSPTFEHCPFSY